MSKTLTFAFRNLLVAVVLVAAVSTYASQGTHLFVERAVASEVQITANKLSKEIQTRIDRVPEFRFMREEAKRMGVSIYLFGGTAAGFAHYVKWDLQREAGDKRFQPDRFDYDFLNIYRSTQDLDIVIDGSPRQINELQVTLQQKFPHLQGSKTAWEVRSLREDVNGKIALLNNPDFLNQNTDSNSTGMIDLSARSKNAVRDLRDWESSRPQFLSDIADGKIHYYLSDTHHQTALARAGKNPPILSAIRLLIKAVQFEVAVRPEDMAAVEEIIRNFNPREYPSGSYVNSWIEKNAKKLVQNAVNIEYALNLTARLGLRDKLIALNNNPHSSQSLAWWMSKKALESQPVGEGGGRTARELKIEIVAHETSDFLAYESITRAHTGDPNVLISRNGRTGEAAVHGEGFYTAIGRIGARNTGMTVRFQVNPNAREGADFLYVPNHNFVIFLNKSAIRVIPESLNFGFPEYFDFLRSSTLDNSDRAILEKLNRRIANKMTNISKGDIRKVEVMIREELSKAPITESGKVVLNRWLGISSKYKDASLNSTVFNKVIAEFKDDAAQLTKLAIANPELAKLPEFLTTLIKCIKTQKIWEGTITEIAQDILTVPGMEKYPSLFRTLMDRSYHGYSSVIVAMTKIPNLSDQTQLIDEVLRYQRSRPQTRDPVRLLYLPGMEKHISLYSRLMKADHGFPHVIKAIAGTPDLSKHSALIDQLNSHIKNYHVSSADARFIADNILSKPGMEKYPDLFFSTIKLEGALESTLHAIARVPDLHKNVDLITRLTSYINNYNVQSKIELIAHNILKKPGMAPHTGLFRAAMNNDPNSVISAISAIPDLEKYPDLTSLVTFRVRNYNLSRDTQRFIALHILPKSNSKTQAPILRVLLRAEAESGIMGLAAVPNFNARAELISELTSYLSSMSSMLNSNQEMIAERILPKAGKYPELFRNFLAMRTGSSFELTIEAISQMHPNESVGALKVLLDFMQRDRIHRPQVNLIQSKILSHPAMPMKDELRKKLVDIGYPEFHQTVTDVDKKVVPQSTKEGDLISFNGDKMKIIKVEEVPRTLTKRLMLQKADRKLELQKDSYIVTVTETPRGTLTFESVRKIESKNQGRAGNMCSSRF